MAMPKKVRVSQPLNALMLSRAGGEQFGQRDGVTGGVLEVVDAVDLAEFGDLGGGQPDAGGAGTL